MRKLNSAKYIENLKKKRKKKTIEKKSSRAVNSIFPSVDEHSKNSF